jgi:hypothetical protein
LVVVVPAAVVEPFSVPFTPSDELPTPNAVPELPTAVPADVCPGEVPSSALPLSFENDDVAPNEEASVVVPVVAVVVPLAFGEVVPGAVDDAWLPVVVVVVLVVFVVPVVDVSGVAPGVGGTAGVIGVGVVVLTERAGVTLAPGVAAVVVAVLLVVVVADVAAIAGARGMKMAASASATDTEGDFARGERMAELLSGRCPVRSDALQCVCQPA